MVNRARSRAQPLSPRGRGREAMTCGRVLQPNSEDAVDGTAASHSAELVRGNFPSHPEGPLIRPFGAPSPQGEKDMQRGSLP
jgi:hypothetical protein